MKINFEKNYAIDYKKMGVTEKKNNFDYISWSHVHKIMKTEFPEMEWEMVWNENLNSYNWDGFVKIRFFNKGEKMLDVAYPIMNFAFKSITNPTSTDINKAQMRGFAKAFAMLTGHGLSLFTGEDLVDLDEAKATKKEPAKVKASIKKAISDSLGAGDDFYSDLVQYFILLKKMPKDKAEAEAKTKVAYYESKTEDERKNAHNSVRKLLGKKENE